jgi:mannose-6-phosphate isomerase-like protein (cupin superfamily)
MIIIHADKVKGVWSSPPHQRELKVLLSPDLQQTSKELSVGMVILPSGESGDPHIHIGSQETWFVLSGNGKLIIGDETAELRPDTLVVAPAGVKHQIINDGNEPLRALFIFSPSGPEKAYLPKGEV